MPKRIQPAPALPANNKPGPKARISIDTSVLGKLVMQSKTVREIARIMGLKHATAQRAREKFRREYQNKYGQI